MSSESFPFSLEDIQGWLIRRKDGVVLHYKLVNAKDVLREEKKDKGTSKWGPAFFNSSGKKHYSDWCEHAPDPSKQDPIFSHDGIGIWIADAAGAKKNHDLFDVAIDGGGVLPVAGEHDYPILCGEPGLVRKLSRHVAKSDYKGPASGTRILKIRWFDRDAPPVFPAFWPTLLETLRSMRDPSGALLKVLTICQGGHGRSGTAAASLIMCLTDYTPLDVLTHIRALHCARAIESKIQHEYLNLVAQHLGRDQNAMDAATVSSFRDRFLASESQWAGPYKTRVETGKGAGLATREAGYL